VTGPAIQVQNAQLLQNLFDLLGLDSAPGVQFPLVQAVLPVAIVQDADSTVIDRLSWGTETRAGVAGENAHVQLFNPTVSGKVLHVDSVIVVASSTSTCRITTHDSALTTLSTTAGFRDRRLTGAPIGQIRSVSNAGTLGSEVGQFGIDAVNATILIPIDAFLDAGQGLMVVNNSTNVDNRVTFYWEEIPRRP
jgi:hypothetical protein